MSTTTLIIVCITAGVHIVGLGVFFAWMAAGYPMSKAQLQKVLQRWRLPLIAKQMGADEASESR